MGFSNERMRTGQLVNWFLLDGLELTPAGNPVTKALPLPFGVDHLIGFNELLTCRHPENAGVTDYINPVMQSNGKALSQNANWAAANKLPLTARQQAMMDAVDKLAKPIGQETTLYRADHDDFLKRLKVNNYQSMSDSQLRKALVGKTWTNDCLESTAYDSRDNPFWPQPGGSRSAGKHGQGGSVSGNREVLIRYHTAKSTRAAFIQPSQSEAVLAVGTHHKITGVRSTRTGPSRTYGSGKRVIELEIEVW